MDGEVWTGKLDYTLLRPINIQFLVSLRYWRLFALFDLTLALVVLGAGITRAGMAANLSTLTGALVVFPYSSIRQHHVVYAFLLFFSALVFISAGVLFTWVFDALYQWRVIGWYLPRLAATDTHLGDPGWIMTTVPAQALAGDLSPALLAGATALALAMLVFASLLFRRALRRYTSASS